jgi:peptidoglycan hydrolase-like protein with peptidoglycan-binding domain
MTDAARCRSFLSHIVTTSALALAAGLLLASAGCRFTDGAAPEEGSTTMPSEAQGSREQIRASVPIDGYSHYDPQEIEAGRRDDSWRTAADWDHQQRRHGNWLALEAQPGPASGDAVPRGAPARGSEAPIERLRQTAGTQPTTPPTGISPAPTAGDITDGETWEDIGPAAFAPFQPRFPVSKADGGPTVVAVQQLLDRVGFSPGVIDGRWGKNTEKALYWLQDSLGLEPTGEIDELLYERLRQAAGTTGPVKTYRVTAEDVAGPYTTIPEDVQEKAKLDCMCYRSAAEALAERFHTTRDLLDQLNPQAALDQLEAGTQLLVPDVEPLLVAVERPADEVSGGPRVPSGIAALVASKDGFYLHALDAEGRVLYHFPTTVGAGYDASPSEDLTVTAIAFRPTFHYQPKLFSDVPDDEPTALLPAGPNSPVGVVWMQLSKQHFGIHGTSEPATIGYSTSHGCIRLTNWDAQFLAERLPEGTPVMFRGDHPDDVDTDSAAGGP